MQILQSMLNPKSKKRIPFEQKSNNKAKLFQFLYSSAISPHPQKIDKGGQDAVFVSKNILVVADGVGSWKQFGVDPGIYSKNLIKIISDLIQDEEKRNYYIQNPQRLASAAVNLNKQQGSTTLSIITLHPKTGLLKTYHIGDSIYGIFKDDSQPILGGQQQYLFNHPFQVGSSFIHRDSGEEMEFCKPNSGIYNQFNYQEIQNSHIVLASDGIWDNIFCHQIHSVLKQSQNNPQKQDKNNGAALHIKKSVQKLIKMTQNTYNLKSYESPFYKKAKQNGLNVGKYAKIDDLSLIVAKVVQRQVE